MSDRLTDDQIRALIEGSTPGKVCFGSLEGQINVVTGDGAVHPIRSPDSIWVVWQSRDDGGVYLAVTGDGPTSKGNAMLFAFARTLAAEVLDLRARVAEYEHAEADRGVGDE